MSESWNYDCRTAVPKKGIATCDSMTTRNRHPFCRFLVKIHESNVSLCSLKVSIFGVCDAANIFGEWTLYSLCLGGCNGHYRKTWCSVISSHIQNAESGCLALICGFIPVTVFRRQQRSKRTRYIPVNSKFHYLIIKIQIIQDIPLVIQNFDSRVISESNWAGEWATDTNWLLHCVNPNSSSMAGISSSLLAQPRSR
jgi:hypothetical protein